MAALEKKAHAPFPRAAKPSNPAARLKRSKSDLGDKDVKGVLRSSQKVSNQTKLILQLEMHLKDQQVVRGALEKALGPDPAPITLQNESPMLKPATQLIREVATLELEIKHLEQYLLTLYRKAFDQQQQQAPTSRSSDAHREAPKLSVSSRSAQLDETPKTKAPIRRGGDPMLHHSCPPISKGRNGAVDDSSPSTCPRRTTDFDHGLRSQSALSFRGVCSSRISPTEDSLARALRSCHSQPFSFLEEGETATSGVVSLADYLGTNVADHIPETPNNLAEEMVRCMAGVFCKLADPPLVHHRPSSSPSSSLSSASVVSPQYLGDMWSPNCRREATLDSRLINPFHVEGLKEFSGPYNTMVEVPSISRDRRRFRDAEDLLQTYKLILYRLETVDLRRMTNEEKLAFWINIHNALLMHAYLKYGVPQNNLKKTSLLVKAECKIAGSTINAAVIQGLVLGCSTHCTGHVRVYFPKRLSQQLEAAREEYIRATVGVWKEHRVLLPKLVEAYARDAKLSPERLVDAVQRSLPESLRTAVQRCRRGGGGGGGRSAGKVVEWLPHRQSFRYLLARDLAFPHLS
ncbi:hypothetical protein BAE44_0013876 [Dichanthelium oligosanthes]|uniref:DUF547 domain-containing protein n=1 Tax=Dichanthelium oligosanthes TaxID=888268 RepID=A0A1E5VJ26_9POAL|nr:hypothetical protein BAE44_0013876 [Dichanthelium oligosanthes]